MLRKLKVVARSRKVEANPVVKFPNHEPLPAVEPPTDDSPAVETPCVAPSAVEPSQKRTRCCGEEESSPCEIRETQEGLGPRRGGSPRGVES